VYVAGGGNSAGQAALHLARYAERVTLVVRAQSLEAGMSRYLIQTVEAAPNVEVRTGTTVVGGGGEGHLQRLVLREGATGEDDTVAADALFVLIGARPQTEWLPGEVARDGYGFLLTGDAIPADDWPLGRRPLLLETSLPGVLAAGDVRHASVKRVAAAVGEGSIAIQSVLRLVADRPGHSPRRRRRRPREAPAPVSASRSTARSRPRARTVILDEGFRASYGGFGDGTIAGGSGSRAQAARYRVYALPRAGGCRSGPAR
jgi:thioredoxin reductase (NADPH)